jgi:hypothetical protein
MLQKVGANHTSENRVLRARPFAMGSREESLDRRKEESQLPKRFFVVKKVALFHMPDLNGPAGEKRLSSIVPDISLRARVAAIRHWGGCGCHHATDEIAPAIVGARSRLK